MVFAIAESHFGTNFGADITLSGDILSELFDETQSRFVVTVKPENATRFKAIVEDAIRLGEVTDTGRLIIQSEDKVVINGELSTYENAWKGAIPCSMTVN